MQPKMYLVYLRKSRADVEAEARGEGETFARHERLLMALAKQKNLVIGDTYREIESGDSIAARPMMQRLLSEVGQGIWAGVLVVEVERLARGDTIDQGIVAQAFKFSATKIVTPLKTYDPENEFDEEYFEFGLFMSRREYKTINRRLQRGRLAAVQEGKYIMPIPPYGYARKRLENEKGYTLEIVPAEADVVRLAFQLYTQGEPQDDGTHRRIGMALIAKKLNAMGIKSRKGGEWTLATLRDILSNPVYIGKLRWNWRPHTKRIVDGEVVISRPKNNNNCTIAQGIHRPIISDALFEAAQVIISTNGPRPVGALSAVKNPMAGIIFCGVCGRSMVRRPYAKERNIPDTLMCPMPRCKTVSSRLELVEQRLLESLAKWADGYSLQWHKMQPQHDSTRDIQEKAVEKIRQEVSVISQQRGQLHDLLEQGIYNTETFLERSNLLAQRMDEASQRLLEGEAALDKIRSVDYHHETIIPKIKHLITVYDTLETPQAKNDILRDVLEKVVYSKERDGNKVQPDAFQLVLYPRIPSD